jgi:predicted alpha/beta-fold hydrolase
MNQTFPCPPFQAAWWCRGAHLQTLWPVLARRPPNVLLRRERLELPDGDFIDLDWLTPVEPSGPLVVILHGLEGSSDSQYARGLLAAIGKRGWRAVVMHFRGCSGEPNRLARSYHSGETGDLTHVISALRARSRHAPLGVVGYSLGGNVLLKWLGESGATTIDAAVAVSVPFDLACAAERLERGVSRVYQWELVRRLHASVERKRARIPLPLRVDVGTLRTFRSFDEHVTAPLHGFRGADHYYAVASSRQYLHGIRVPTLLLHAADDPFMTAQAVPRAEELSPTTTLELSAHGGHVGFIAGRWPWRPDYWLEQRIPAFLEQHLARGAEPATETARA